MEYSCTFRNTYLKCVIDVKTVRMNLIKYIDFQNLTTLKTAKMEETARAKKI